MVADIVIPATQEAEAGELPEPRRRTLQLAKIVPLHSSLGNKNKTVSKKKIKVLLSHKLTRKKKDGRGQRRGGEILNLLAIDIYCLVKQTS